MFDKECIQTIIHKYFEQNNILTYHQIESYDDFIDNIFPTIISQFFPFTLEYSENSKIKNITIDILNLHIDCPYYTENNGCSKIMTPNIARLRNFTYSLIIKGDLSIKLGFSDKNSIVYSVI